MKSSTKLRRRLGQAPGSHSTPAREEPFWGSSELPESQAGKPARGGLQQVCDHDPGPVPALGIGNRSGINKLDNVKYNSSVSNPSLPCSRPAGIYLFYFFLAETLLLQQSPVEKEALFQGTVNSRACPWEERKI